MIDHKNVIFYDTEFSDLNIRTGELLSIGLVSYSGDELYIELPYNNPVHPWVEEHVLPYLNGKQVDKQTARTEVTSFVQKHSRGAEKPYLVAYVNQFDSMYWYDLFESPTDHPVFWIPIDFASILFAHGFEPNSMGKESFFELLNIEKAKFTAHNALEDARLLRETYVQFFEYIQR
ncbi:MAG: hypothetical protein A3J66_03860 [Candidatus Magasanikbacteria bacterium RIFCSPHIGHO2_02_FULL_47_14]|uniref:Uncharacterized protein n=1 Tax=Candidatus Magasanikbacteria bacterium RIFCSPHIGHO2_02_FULL_47_14 TaxID=1798680 RepID=A0A1F6M119_9BACT|nr:MAG: hypothetical protein A3J66_03860 [Candidatus Magasanikbacteria bacterium RIFCSPHIGHO2_02_FULL_47_14]